MKKYLLIAAILCVPIAAFGWGIGLIGSGGGESSGCDSGVEICDDFSGDLSNWTVLAGSWDIASGELDADTGGDNKIVYNSPLSSTSGWALVKITANAATSSQGFIFRVEDLTCSANKYNYQSYWYPDTDTFQYFATEYNCGNDCSTSYVETFDHEVGGYAGMMWEGTWANTKVWRFAWDAASGDPGPGPWNKTTGGDYRTSWEAGFCNSHYADTGLYVGFSVWISSGDPGNMYDNFEAGTYTP